jgi:hypothetical protein
MTTIRVRANARMEALEYGEVGDLPLNPRTQAWIDSGLVSVVPDQDILVEDPEPTPELAPQPDPEPQDVEPSDPAAAPVEPGHPKRRRG